MALIAAMIGILLLDAVTRNLIKMPLHWCIELAQFTLAAYYFMGGAMTLKNNDHVRMDLFYDRLSGRGRRSSIAVTVLFVIFYLGVLLSGGISSPNTPSLPARQRYSSGVRRCLADQGSA